MLPQCSRSVCDVRPTACGNFLEYQVEWDDEGQVFYTWEDEVKIEEDLKKQYWFGHIPK